MRYYDIENRRLIYFKEKKVENDYWDAHWKKNITNFSSKLTKLSSKSLVSRITREFLDTDAGPILEGGCGLGGKVLALLNMGYNVYGIDNAKSTIGFVKSKIPEINIQYGDIRKLSFSDNFFAGYWSLGVIEHFYKGPSDVIKEMYRVIEPNGYLFLTFPYMSPFRRFKARFNLYKIFNTDYYKLNKTPNTFYQFALNSNEIIKKFESLGFNLKYSLPHAGIKGFKDEIFFLKFYLKRFLQLLYETYKPEPVRKMKRFLDMILIKFSAHMILLVFQKT